MSYEYTPGGDQSNRHLRELSGVERWFYWMDQNRSTHFSISAEIAGVTTPAQWRDALNQLQHRHPLLNAAVVQTEDGSLHFRKGNGEPIPLIVHTRSGETQWQEIAVRELGMPFDPNLSPLFRAILLDGGERCTIILSAYHAIADGKSVAFLLRDLVHAVAGGTLSRLPLRPSQDSLLGSVAAALPANESKPEDATQPPPRPVNYMARDAGPATIESVQLTRDETHALASIARAQGTTVHAAIVAASVFAGRAISAAWRENAVRVFSPIAIRQLLAIDDDSMIALSAGITSSDPAESDCLWEIARDIKRQLLPQQQHPGVVGTLGFFQMSSPSDATPASVSQMAADNVGFELMVTNLGKMPFLKVFGHLTIEALWGPIVNFGFENEQAISVVTVNDTICLVHASVTPLPGLLNRVLERLKMEMAKN